MSQFVNVNAVQSHKDGGTHSVPMSFDRNMVKCWMPFVSGNDESIKAIVSSGGVIPDCLLEFKDGTKIHLKESYQEVTNLIEEGEAALWQ